MIVLKEDEGRRERAPFITEELVKVLLLFLLSAPKK
jgi:hypothetical protein